MSTSPYLTGPQPKDFFGDALQGMFGMCEYEEAISIIVAYLANDNEFVPQDLTLGHWPDLDERGWLKLFRLNTFPKIGPVMFAMLCGAGWIVPSYFPKGTFALSCDAIDRLRAKYAKL